MNTTELAALAARRPRYREREPGMRMMPGANAWRSALLLTVVILVVGAACLLRCHAVDNSLSDEDRRFIPKYLENIDGLPRHASYADELDFIRSVQRAVLRIAPGNAGLPPGQKREPKELYEAGTGLCYDRSRVIEKILRYSGFRTRHVSVFSTAETGSAARALVTPGVASHAVTEVLTRNGWLVVDPNVPWVATDAGGRAVSMSEIQAVVDGVAAIEWSAKPPAEIYVKPFALVYGLYSRHGRFYPPFNFVPDIEYGEFSDNADVIASSLPKTWWQLDGMR